MDVMPKFFALLCVYALMGSVSFGIWGETRAWKPVMLVLTLFLAYATWEYVLVEPDLWSPEPENIVDHT